MITGKSYIRNRINKLHKDGLTSYDFDKWLVVQSDTKDPNRVPFNMDYKVKINDKKDIDKAIGHLISMYQIFKSRKPTKFSTFSYKASLSAVLNTIDEYISSSSKKDNEIKECSVDLNKTRYFLNEEVS